MTIEEVNKLAYLEDLDGLPDEKFTALKQNLPLLKDVEKLFVCLCAIVTKDSYFINNVILKKKIAEIPFIKSVELKNIDDNMIKTKVLRKLKGLISPEKIFEICYVVNGEEKQGFFYSANSIFKDYTILSSFHKGYCFSNAFISAYAFTNMGYKSKIEAGIYHMPLRNYDVEKFGNNKYINYSNLHAVTNVENFTQVFNKKASTVFDFNMNLACEKELYDLLFSFKTLSTVKGEDVMNDCVKLAKTEGFFDDRIYVYAREEAMQKFDEDFLTRE